jgi:CheY-like chemotaxis protein
MSEIPYIIEDSPSDARLLQLLLERAGRPGARVFVSGLDGLNACLMDPPQVLLLDLQLPQLRGEEVLRLLRATERCRHLPIIIVSELADAHRKEMELLGIGANAYLRKPFSPDQLADALKRAFDPNPPDTGESAPLDPPPEIPPEEAAARINTSGSSFGVFRGYRILEMLGAGGMGTVYKATQLSLDRLVALKILKDYHLQDDKMAQRFDREARIMARINHPNIVQVYDFGHTEFHHYISMEYAEGGSVHGKARTGGLTWPILRRIVQQTASALDYLHARQIIHRDIKPSNILLSDDDQVKLADFGITRATLPSDNMVSGVTDESVVIGTRYFLAPEINMGNKGTPASDQYALGMTCWQLLTGKAPSGMRAPVCYVNKTMPRGLSDVVERSLSLDPEARFPTLEAFSEAFLREAPKG